MLSFDYDEQVWVDGVEGAALELRHITESIAILDGPDGVRFLGFVQEPGFRPPTVAAALAFLRARASVCRAEIAAADEVSR